MVRPGLWMVHLGRVEFGAAPRSTSSLSASQDGRASEEKLGVHGWGNSRYFLTWTANCWHHLPRASLAHWHPFGFWGLSAFLLDQQVGILPFPSILHSPFFSPSFYTTGFIHVNCIQLPRWGIKKKCVEWSLLFSNFTDFFYLLPTVLEHIELIH